MIVSYTRLMLLLLALAMGAACSSTEDSGGGDGDGDTGDGDGDGDNGDGDGDGDSGDGDGDGDSGDGDGDGDNGDGDGDGDTTVMNGVDDTAPVGDDLTLFFNPMFSAYVEGIDFFVPAIVQGVTGARWSANPADAVDLQPDSSTGGVLIKTRKPGVVKIIARAGSGSRELSGSAELTITEGTMEEWELGEQRYNNEIAFPEFDAGINFDGGLPDGGFDASGFEIPDDLSCRNCHGSGAEAISVEHTPQQTGGYSDDQLIRIFTMGEKPPTAKFRTGFPEAIYTRFHTWEATEEEQKGIVLYLRYLTPKSQGPLDFGGLRDVFDGN